MNLGAPASPPTKLVSGIGRDGTLRGGVGSAGVGSYLSLMGCFGVSGVLGADVPSNLV